jgi:hypothetical protein
MIISAYLIISEGRRKYSPSVKLAKSLKGKMPTNAIPFKLNIEVPDSIFKKPQFEATIKINEEDISKPVINAHTLDNIRETFEQQLGIEVTLKHVEPDLEFLNYNVELKDYVNKKKK